MEISEIVKIAFDKSIHLTSKILLAMLIIFVVILIDETLGFSRFSFYKSKAETIANYQSILSSKELPKSVRSNIEEDILKLSSSEPFIENFKNDFITYRKSIPLSKRRIIAINNINNVGIVFYVLMMLFPASIIIIILFAFTKSNNAILIEYSIYLLLIATINGILFSIAYINLGPWPFITVIPLSGILFGIFSFLFTGYYFNRIAYPRLRKSRLKQLNIIRRTRQERQALDF